MTLKDIYPKFLEFKKTRMKSSSLACYAASYERWIEPYFGDEDVSEGIDNKKVNLFVEHLLSKGLAKKSADSVKVALGAIMTFANIEWDIPRPTWKIYWPSENMTGKRKIKFFTKEECKKVFKLMDDEPDPRLLGIVIGLTTGVRIGEICGLRFSDIDFDTNTIHVQRTIERCCLRAGIDVSNEELACTKHNRPKKRNSVVLVNSAKTASSNRIVPLAKLPRKWLKSYMKVAENKDSYCITLRRNVLEARNYRNYYYKVLERLELPALNPHCMRHTFATQMLHSNVDVATIASILGHSSPAVTLEIYSHTNEDEKAKAVSRVFGKLFQ